MAAFDECKGPCGAMCTATSAIPAALRFVVSEIARAYFSTDPLQTSCESIMEETMNFHAVSLKVST